MSLRGKAYLIALMALMGCLVGCSSVSNRDDAAAPHRFDPAADPYWLDPRWDKTLLDAVQSVVHDPVDAADISARGLRATVKFTFADGAVEYPALVAGTGNQDLDDLLLRQVASAQIPKPTGLHADEPHDFLLDLDMPTPYEAFQYSVYASIDRQKVYPKDPIIAGATGNTTVGFDYLDGQANNIAMTISSKNKDLDRSSVGAVMKATLPSAPEVYAGKSMHMEAVFCYSLIFSPTDIKNKCPTEKNVILVQGTRIKIVTVETYMH